MARPAAKVSYFPNGLDTDGARAALGRAPVRAARDALGIPPDAVVALHFGRDWELKGGDVFLEPMARLQGSPPSRAWSAMSPRGGEPARALAAELGIGAAHCSRPTR